MVGIILAYMNQTMIPREITVAHYVFLMFVFERYSLGYADSNASLITVAAAVPQQPATIWTVSSGSKAAVTKHFRVLIQRIIF